MHSHDCAEQHDARDGEKKLEKGCLLDKLVKR
jgi:hypothetical protein